MSRGDHVRPKPTDHAHSDDASVVDPGAQGQTRDSLGGETTSHESAGNETAGNEIAGNETASIETDTRSSWTGPSIPSPRSWFSSANFGPNRRAQADLIAALNDVADAVSSTISLDQVLETIVERAKRITNTEKAVLVLTVDHGSDLDADTLVVRGARDEHPQSWWAAQLQGIAPRVFESGDTYLDLDHENNAWLLCAPILVKNRPIGLLCAINSKAHRFGTAQIDFLAILGAFAATAIENARLAEETRYVLLASERDRIAREMHDGISQSLFSVALGLEVCRKQVLRDPASVAERLKDLQEQVDLSRSELRRFIYDLRPLKLQELGLVGAVEYWLHEVCPTDGVHAEVKVDGERRALSPSMEACLYRVAKESIANSMKHATPTKLGVFLTYQPESVRLMITDNGSGFDPVEVRKRSQDETGIGLRSIEDRVRTEGGEMHIASAPGRGTRIDVVVPT